jgi:hypothetical protein
MLFCLIDHDNVSAHLGQLNHLLSGWLAGLSREHTFSAVEDLVVRSYGGWWREDAASDARFSAAQLYSEYCPALISTEGHYWRVRFEFADNLLVPPGFPGFAPPFHHTVVSRPAPPLTIADAGGPVCEEVGCEVQRCRRWLFRRRGCTRNACPKTFGQVWMRTEQKQVDTHLAIDLVQVCKLWMETVHVALVSDDVDFLPALAASTLGASTAASVTHVRIAGRPTYLDQFLIASGVRILVP